MTGEAPQAPGVVGSVVAGRFRVERSLGSGGMADVFAARDLATGRAVAVKLLKKDVANNPEATERLRREGEVLKKLEHPAVVRLETFGKLEDGRLFIAMELLEGETLGERLRREGKLDPADLTPILAGACAGLEAAHGMGIVHRDLKPDNVFLEEGPQGMQVKLLDFGISKITGSDKLTQTGEVLGTPRYMAPEQLSAERDLDGRTDVYALGVILYEALAGSPPFLAATPTDLIVAILHGKVAPLRSFRPDLPEDVDAVITRAMSRVREARHGSARELTEAWLAVAAPPERSSLAGPAPAREGMATAPLGSLSDDAAPEPDSPGGADLRPGTFSALAAAAGSVPAPVVDSIDPVAPTAPGPPASPSRVRARERTPTVPLGPSSARGDASAEYRVPTSGARTTLIVGGVLAGALSAGLAILALKLLNPQAEAAEQSPAAGVEMVPSSPAAADAPPAAEPELEEGIVPPPGEADPSGAGGEEARPDTEDERRDRAEEASAPSPVERRRAGRRRPTRTAAAPSSEAPAPSTPADLMREARAALRNGDARTCVTLVDRAIDAGAPTAALRLRGDCLVRLGDREEGLKSYERFCRLAPDHPAIGEVRALVEGLGGRCD